MRMLNMDLVRAPAVSDVVQDDFDDLDIVVANPGPPFGVPVNVARCVNGIHGFLASSPPTYYGFGRKTKRFALFFAHERVAIVLRRNKSFLDGARGNPAHEVEHAAGLVVRSRSPRSEEHTSE